MMMMMGRLLLLLNNFTCNVLVGVSVLKLLLCRALHCKPYS